MRHARRERKGKIKVVSPCLWPSALSAAVLARDALQVPASREAIPGDSRRSADSQDGGKAGGWLLSSLSLSLRFSLSVFFFFGVSPYVCFIAASSERLLPTLRRWPATIGQPRRLIARGIDHRQQGTTAREMERPRASPLLPLSWALSVSPSLPVWPPFSVLPCAPCRRPRHGQQALGAPRGPGPHHPSAE